MKEYTYIQEVPKILDLGIYLHGNKQNFHFDTGSELNFEGGVIGPVKSSSAGVTNSVMANTNVTVGEEMTMEQGVLAVGSLENAGTIKGDVIAMQNVVNTGEIGGDAIAANGNVTNSGTVSGDVLAENGTVDNSGTISGSLTTKDGPIVAYVNGTGYTSLADAITAAGSGTVVLQGSQTENTTVGTTVTIEVPAGVTFTTDETGLKVVASSGCTLTTGGTAGAYTYTAEKIVTELGFPQNPHSNSQRSYQQFPLTCIPNLI